MDVPLIQDIIKASGIHHTRVFCIYLFGSRVYGTSNESSDYDIIMVANNSVEAIEITNGKFNIHVYTPKKFKEDLDWHRINNLECIFAPEWAKIKEDIKWDFVLDKNKLRHAISHISSNSWVKCKKKLEHNEYYVGIKSLFHSLRIANYGYQIASNGTIIDFKEVNHVWDDLTFKHLPKYMRDKHTWKWSELDAKFKHIHNEYMSNFRKVASKC